MEAEAALKRAVEHWQFRRKRAAVSSLVGYTFRSTKGRALDAEAAASFRRKVAARLLRVLWLSVVQRCAYSDGWRWARSTSIALGALARAKQVNECSEKRLQLMKQSQALHQSRSMQRAFFGLFESANSRLEAAVQQKMGEAFHRRYNLWLTLFWLKIRHMRRKCSACRTQTEAVQRATAHIARRYLALWRANIQLCCMRRRQRLQQHAEEVQRAIQQWVLRMRQRIVARTTCREASDWHTQVGLVRALAQWNSTSERQSQARIQQSRIMYIARTNALASLWHAFVRNHSRQKAQQGALELAKEYRRRWMFRQALRTLHISRSWRQHLSDAEEQATIAHSQMQLTWTLHRLREWQWRKLAWRTHAHDVVERAIAARQPSQLARHIQAWNVQMVRQRLQSVVSSRCEGAHNRKLAQRCFCRLQRWVRRCKQHHVATRRAVRHRVTGWNRRLFQQLIANVHEQRTHFLGLLKSTRLWKFRRLFQGMHALWTFSQARKVAVQLRLRAARIRRKALLQEAARRLLAIKGPATPHSPRRRPQLTHDIRSHQPALLRTVFHAWKQVRPQKQTSTRCTGHRDAMSAALFHSLPAYSRSIPFITGPAVGALTFIPPSDPLAKEPPRTASWLDDPIVISQPSPALRPTWASGSTPVHTGNATTTTTMSGTAANNVVAADMQKQLRHELATAIMQFVSDVRFQLQPGDHQTDPTSTAVA